MFGKRVLLMIVSVVLFLMPVALAYPFGFNNYGYDYGSDANRGFNVYFDNRESSGSGYEQTTYSGFNEGFSDYDTSSKHGYPHYNSNHGYGESNDYFNQYSDTVETSYEYNNKDSRVYGNFYGNNNYYYDNYGSRTGGPSYKGTPYGGYGNYGSPYHYNGNYQARFDGNRGAYRFTNHYKAPTLGGFAGYYNGGRINY